jgi:hypothetical protein
VRPVLLDKTGNSPILLSLISSITSVDCYDYFSEHLGKSQQEQKSIVESFQNFTKSILECDMPEVMWSLEYSHNHNTRDSIDIFGQGSDFLVAIELDKHRADQVAKKFVSRIAILSPATIYFISLCYPGTKKMNKSECTKYFGYCTILANQLGVHYAGLVIE